MKLYFLDSSALVKRYVAETGSAWVQNLTDPASGNAIVVARITWVEVHSAFSRLQRMQNLSPQDVATAIEAFRFDWKTQYQVVELKIRVTQLAGQLVQNHILRAYDAVQLASALYLFPEFANISPNSFTFISADSRLLNIAQAEGLPIDDPINHP